MGKGTFETQQSSESGLTVGWPGAAPAASKLAETHELEPSAALEDLIDYLSGLSCRDQDDSAFDPKVMKGRRREGAKLARAMQQQASAIIKGFESIHQIWQEFDKQVQANPSLLEAIFDVNTGGPAELALPPSLSVLETLFPTYWDEQADQHTLKYATVDLASLSSFEPCPPGLWEALDRRLQAVIDLPVRSQRKRGPVPNHVVRSSVAACRSYWRAIGRSWSMSGLKYVPVRQENVVQNLTGACELFVAEALTAAGIRFNLQELHSAWEYVDSAECDALAAKRS